MIITSLLDTDLYKFTMMQVVLHQFPGAQVEYRFKCRNAGMALAPYAGKVIADAIRGDPARLDRFAALPAPPFPGGKRLRKLALAAGMTWYALRDRL